MKGYTKEDNLNALRTLLSDETSAEEKEAAGKVALAYQEQLEKDCKVCRYYWDHSTSEEGEHDFSCPHHPKNYDDVRIRCMCCGCTTFSAEPSAIGSTIWHSRGNYGSRLVDRTAGCPEVGTLRIEICDLCLIRHRSRIFDSTSGKWAPWEPFVPPEEKREVIRIHQDEDGKFVATTSFLTRGGHFVVTHANSVLDLLEELMNRERHATKKGHPLQLLDDEEE